MTVIDSVRDESPRSSQIRPLLVTIDDACILLGRRPKTGRSSINQKIARGELDAVKDGDRTLVTMESVERLAASLPPAQFKPQSAQPAKPRKRNGHQFA
jgi:hypothetical protein